MVAIGPVHFKNNAVATIIWNVNMHRRIGGPGKHSKIKFTKAIGGFNQLGEVDVSYECKIHSTLVWENKYASIMQLLLNKIIRLFGAWIREERHTSKGWCVFCRCEFLNGKDACNNLHLRHLSGIDQRIIRVRAWRHPNFPPQGNHFTLS